MLVPRATWGKTLMDPRGLSPSGRPMTSPYGRLALKSEWMPEAKSLMEALRPETQWSPDA